MSWVDLVSGILHAVVSFADAVLPMIFKFIG